MKRFLRYLRITFSATCLIACVLLIVLWVRSYHWVDEISYRGSNTRYGVQSAGGTVAIYRYVEDPIPYESDFGWFVSNFKTDEIGFNHISTMGFVWAYVPSQLCDVGMPHIFLATVASIASIVGALPWIRWRFSVRTLLIATTLIAVLLGLIVRLSR